MYNLVLCHGKGCEKKKQCVRFVEGCKVKQQGLNDLFFSETPIDCKFFKDKND